jgi:hypothetical protein
MKPLLQILLLAVALVFPPWLRAEVALPKAFGDNMVLQREKPVQIWGTASPGEEVSVSFGAQKKRDRQRRRALARDARCARSVECPVGNDDCRRQPMHRTKIGGLVPSLCDAKLCQG